MRYVDLDTFFSLRRVGKYKRKFFRQEIRHVEPRTYIIKIAKNTRPRGSLGGFYSPNVR